MKSPEPKDITDVIGPCGRFQIFLTLAITSPVVIAVWGMMFMTFGLYNPGWMCLDQEEPSILPYIPNASTIVVYTIISTAGVSTSDTDLNGTTWSRNCSVRDKCQSLVYNEESSSVVSHWDLSCDSSWIPSVIISIQMGGAIIGAYVTGQISDRLGRKISIYGQIAINCVSHLLASVSVSWQMYASAFFLIGFSCGGILSCGFPYPLEFLTEKWRGIFAALPVWNIGFTTFATAVIIWKDWRYLHITTCVIMALIFIPVFWAPESVRWLTVKGKTDRSKQVIADIARMNKRPLPDTNIVDDIADEEKERMGSYQYTYADLFRNPNIRGYSVKFGIIWMSLAGTYYIISFGINALSGNFFMNLFLFSVFEMPGMLFVAPAVNILGRRKAALLFFGTEIVVSVSLVIVTLSISGTLQGVLILLLALLFKLIIGSAWSIIALFSSELYPTVVRSIQHGYLNSVAQFGAMVSPFLIPRDSQNLYSMFVIITVLVSLIFGLLWTLPETKGRVLQDIVYKPAPRKDVNEEKSSIV